MTEWLTVLCINGMLYNLERPAHMPEDHRALYIGWTYPTGEPCKEKQNKRKEENEDDSGNDRKRVQKTIF